MKEGVLAKWCPELDNDKGSLYNEYTSVNTFVHIRVQL